MAIRITGMYSGLDTESIINELVSAQSVKKSKYVKDQTKLSWKMDAWKALNTKIYNFYTNTLDNMRYQATYLAKATKVSNSSAVSVIAGKNAVDGVQKMSVDSLATSGKLTGRDLSLDLENVKSSTRLKELGFEGNASFDVTVGGKTTTIKIDGNTKISDVVTKLKNAGVNANFDEKNHRFYLSANSTGSKADFSITANDANGLKALDALGLVTKADLDNEEYKKWASYKDPANAQEYADLIAAEVKKRAASYKKANDALEKKNEELRADIEDLKANESYQAGKTADELYDEMYGKWIPELDEDDNEVKDENGETVMVREGGLKAKVDAAKEAYEKAVEDLKIAEENEVLTEEDKEFYRTAVTEAKEKLTGLQDQFKELSDQYSVNKAVEDKQAQIDANDAAIAANKEFYDVQTEEDPEGNVTETVVGTTALENNVTAEFDTKRDLAYDIVNGNSGIDADRLATRVKGENAKITLDGVTYESASNDFTINGMTITVYETADEVTLTTATDVDGIYDMIKNFFKEYNSLINEMSALYNADSAKGYDPLTSEEKAEMADSDIEEWEKKIKDSLLRRDSTLGDLTDSIRTVMIQGAKVNGKTMYLSDFGINTLGYFNAKDNEKGAYHIYGDQDDADVKSEDDILKRMIATDQDSVMKFFSGLSQNLYDKLSAKMAGIKDTSSAFTVYNDKTMQKEYDNYKSRIAKEEEKLNALMDKWYGKFSQMETALAKLQSKSGSLGSMFGGQ